MLSKANAEHLVLVGPNDVGKSSLLRCLDLLLGDSTAQLYNRITIDDFADSALPFTAEAELEDLSPLDQGWFPDEVDVASEPRRVQPATPDRARWRMRPSGW
jgi:putative ATP-dependent endonuclease of OLD family